MPIIKKLSPHEAQKIAAGEVVERPANIVKELVENALDARATRITIFLEQAGKKLIRVQDDGNGMDADDAALCFEHHATSKITHVDELQSIDTFGFRGEALSSIAAVSKVNLITKQKDAAEGIEIQIHNGIIAQQKTVPATQGTDITVTHVFDAMPARKKFLKTKETEWRHVQQLFFALALDYIHISFALHSEQKLLFNCPAVDSIQKRFEQLLDHDISNHLLTLQTPDNGDGIRLAGVISNQQYGRYDRNSIYMFVNNRWVKDYKLNRALINGYNNALPVHQYPLGCIKIDIDPSWIDVNIHPRKEEVQFLHPNKVYNAIKQAVAYTLEQFVSRAYEQPVDGHSYKPAGHITNDTEPPLSFSFDMLLSEPFAQKNNTAPVPMPHIPAAPVQPQQEETAQKNVIVSEDADQRSHTIIGVLHKTYILVEQDNGLMMIDQHAAHERVIYEQFKNERNPTTIQLLFPQTITCARDDITLLVPHLATLNAYGIEAELFSDTQIVVKSTPIQLKNASLESLIHNCIATLHQERESDSHTIQDAFAKALHADMACKAAVKAGDTLSHEQIQTLLNDLAKTDNRFTCPHGRPTSWHLATDMIKKKFKRDYRAQTS